MDWLETKYISLVSSRLERFTRKSGNSYNFRCPFCGDSKKNKTKARGWVFDRGGKTRYYCHNCNESMSFNRLIENLDKNLYNEMKLERMRDAKPGYNPPKAKVELKQFRPAFESSTALKDLKRVSQLKHNDPFKEYVVDRRIPFKFHYKLYVVDRFFEYVNKLLPNKFDEKTLEYDAPRLLIPFINKEDKVHALQGRSFDPKSKTKYITVVLDENVPKVYGLDTWDSSREAYVTEGPIDSMFLDNGLATAGGDLASALHGFPKDKLVIVYDNERRSKDTVRKMNKAISQGYKVCFWPEEIVYKDINDMVKSGMRPEYVQLLVEQNSYAGLRAEMEMSRWKRVAV